MSKQTQIENLLGRLRKGEREVLPKLCSQLAERLLSVPSLASKDDGNQTKVSVLQIRVEDTPAIACFTSDGRFKEWMEVFGFSYERLDLFGSDLAMVMDTDRALLIDPLTPHEVMLEPIEVSIIRNLFSDSVEQKEHAQAQPVDNVKEKKETPLPRPSLLDIPSPNKEDSIERLIQQISSPEIIKNPNPEFVGDNELAETKKNHSRVLERTEYDSETLVHHGPVHISDSIVFQSLGPYSQDVIEPLFFEASDLPLEVAQRVAKLLKQRNNRNSNSIYRPEEFANPTSDTRTIVPKGGKKKKGLFGFLKN